MAPLAHTLALLAMTVATAAIHVNVVGMAQDTFDDQYRGCSCAMTAALPALNRSEFQKNLVFARVWAKAKEEWERWGFRVPPLSSPEQAIAVMAYTTNDLRKEFNDAMRKAGRSPQEYRDNFHFKTFHFLLTHALGTLRDDQNMQCRRVFRGVHDVHFKAQCGQTIRFSQFTTTSLSKETAQKYRTDTIFQVHTCYGVDIQNFSFSCSNHPVLIPPYETFEVTEVTQEGNKSQIKLRSTGTFSKYNCEWLKGGSISMVPFRLGGFILVTTALTVATTIL
ncbi:NAD(P)(+)--arginine ADP-ribosyltransferase 2-like [Chamaea fasciata]|uniref:NAD(P)(+)--arginine ADP-ribosyltransferase 2-like n=1 Tax=Chamaea fasciata TaxID=190680 RepID=UPI00336A3256